MQFPTLIKRLCLGGVLMLVSVAVPSSLHADEALNLLFFGNSFTYYNNHVEVIVRDLATAAGYATPNVIADTQGSSNLAYHQGQVSSNPTSNVTHPSLLDGDTWDFVIMQGQSREATLANGTQTGFRTSALGLYTDVLNQSSGRGAGVIGILYETWAYEETHSTYPGTWANPELMQADISNGYALAANEIASEVGVDSIRVASVGQAFQERSFESSLYNADKRHPSDSGTVLASMVLFSTIYGSSVSEIDFSVLSSAAKSGLSKTEWVSLAATADLVTVPEPGSLMLLACGALLLARKRR